MPPVVTVENLSKHFGRHRAVDDVSFEIGRGEVLGLLGPNGSGKTTILRILTGYLHASAGRVCIAGYDVVEQGIEARRRIGYVPEDAPAYSHMRVAESLGFMGGLKGLDGAALAASIDAACDQLSLHAVRDVAVRKLSRGYRQRVAIAQALLNGPDLLILDEPTNGLDPRQIIEFRQLIAGLAQRHTLLVTSHILAEMERVATRVAILREGRLLATHDMRSTVDHRIRARVRSPDPDAALDALGAVGGVTRVEILSDSPQGTRDYLVHLDGADAAAGLAPALVAGGHSLLEMTPVSVDLESLFLSLTERAAR